MVPIDDAIDPHIHLFDLVGTPRPMQPLGRLFGWNDRILRAAAARAMPSETVNFFGRQTALLGDYLPAHYRLDTESTTVDRYVHIQAGWSDAKPLDPVGETAWLESLDDGPAAIVGHADLSLGTDVGRVLDAHQAVSSRFRGVRHMLSWHPSKTVMDFASGPELSRTQEFRAGFDQLGERGLSFDAWCYSHQLQEVAELAQHNPSVPIVLCHVGTPVGAMGPFGDVGISEQERARIHSAWADGISELATHEHVRCKLSGLLMPVVGLASHERDRNADVEELVDRLSPYVNHCVEAFGPDRCMVASNFPVDKISGSYRVLMMAMAEITSRFGEGAQAAMFRDTAAGFYRL